MKLKTLLMVGLLSLNLSTSSVEAQIDSSRLSAEQVAELLKVVRECDDNELLKIVSLEDSAENFWEAVFIIASSVAAAGAALMIGVKGGTLGSGQEADIQN